MKNFAIALALVALQEPAKQDAPKQDGLQVVMDAAQKLMAKKNYSFKTTMKLDGDDALKAVFEKSEQDVTGVFQKESILHAKAEEIECARNGGEVLFLYNKKWRNREDTNKLFKNKLDSPTRTFDSLDNPHDEIGSVREKVGSLEAKGTEAAGGSDCTKYEGALHDDGASMLAKAYFGRLRVKGAGRKGGQAEPVGASGKATVWVNKDGIPVQLVYDMAFKVVAGKSEWKATLLRTVTVADVDAAKLELPADVKKQLKIE
jgi:hypothetical protein